MSFFYEVFHFFSHIFGHLFPSPHTVVIGMGSNLGDREAILNGALQELKKIGDDFLLSSLWETEPWDDSSTELFLNAVVIFKTRLSPVKLLEALQSIENTFGRKRTVGLKWENRTLDLDVLFYDEQFIETKNFHVPHQHLQSRMFVIAPLAEINPNFPLFHIKKTAKELYDSFPEIAKKSVRLYSSFSQ